MEGNDVAADDSFAGDSVKDNDEVMKVDGGEDDCGNVLLDEVQHAD